MRVRRPRRSHRQRRCVPVCLAGVVLGLAAVTACGHTATPAASRAVSCGTGQTAAHVPIDVSVNNSAVSCAAARSVESAYAAAIRAGKAPGAGGNGPVKVSGWTCSAYSTPEMLKTGNASKCVKGSTEILATIATST